MFANSPEKSPGSWLDLSEPNSSLGNLWSCKEGERTKPPWAPGLSAVGKIAELEQVLGARAAQDWAPSQTAFQVAVKTCRYCSNRARGVCWHCRGSVELVQSQEACSRSSEYLFLPELPAAPVKLLAIPCCKKSLQSCPASETPCGKAKPQGLQPCLGQRNRSAPQIRLLKTRVAVCRVFWGRTGAGTRGSLSVSCASDSTGESRACRLPRPLFQFCSHLELSFGNSYRIRPSLRSLAQMCLEPPSLQGGSDPGLRWLGQRGKDQQARRAFISLWLLGPILLF